MQFGCNEINKRVKPSHTGERAICPFCKSELIAHCGEVYAWHWQHKQNTCDPWSEPETEWHRSWKSYFPDEWQEVIIIRDGIKHIADVQTSDGFVIEFQNSPISRSTIREREKFYGDMVWVVNAEKFKLTKFSLFTKKIEENKKRRTEKRRDYEKDWEYAEDSLETYIENKDKEISNQETKINYHDYNLLQLEGVLAFEDEVINEIIKTWEDGGYYYKNDLSNFLSSKEEKKESYLALYNKLDKLQEALNKEIENLNRINKLSAFYFDGQTFILADHSSFSEKNYQLIIAIRKGTEQHLLPDILEFHSEDHFNSFRFQKNNYLFAIDSVSITQSKEEYIFKISEKIKELKIEIEQFISELKEMLVVHINTKIEELKKKKQECKEVIQSLLEVKNKIIENNKLMASKIADERNEFYREEALSLNEEESLIRHKNKGMFKYWWKNKRPSWDGAENNVFLDLGDDYLYEIINEEQLRRILKIDFINKHNKSN